MADHTHIEWTDATWNPITGCSLTSPGCTNCYAMQLAGTRLAHHESRAGLTREVNGHHVWTGEVRLNEQWFDQPLRWRKPRRIFVCAHGDLFHESAPDEWIDKVFAVMALSPQHTFQVLTKRSQRMREYLSRPKGSWHYLFESLKWVRWMAGLTGNKRGQQSTSLPRMYGPLPNVWLGVSVEDQHRADERIPDLLATPAAVRWISAEPLLGPVDLKGSKLDWVVCGGESGPHARPMHPDWARSLRDQCAAAGVPFLFKQWGEYHTAAVNMSTGEPVFRQFQTYQDWVNKASTWINGGICLDRLGRRCEIGRDFASARDEDVFPITIMHRVGKTRAGRMLDGVLHDAYPEEQR